MNGTTGTTAQKATSVQIIAVVSSALIALTLAFAIMWCAIWKIYIEPTMLMLIGTVLGGIGGALTTVLVGRSLAQLNSPSEGDTTIRQTTETVTTPKPSTDVPMKIVKQPEVAIAEPPPIQT